MHGDFHLDNCLFARSEPRLLAIIDWEISTIGDPLLDLGLFLGLWGGRSVHPAAIERIQGVSRLSGAPGRAELADRYAKQTGRSVDHLPYYMALAFWKLAAIIEGAYAQYVSGRLDSDYARDLGEDVPRLLDEASAIHRR